MCSGLAQLVGAMRSPHRRINKPPVVDIGDYTGFNEFVTHRPRTGPVVQDVLGWIGITLFLPLGEWYRVI